MTLKTLVLRYTAFAVIATLANLATQRLVLTSSQTGASLALAIGSGTIVGLVIKYFLDKRWIFQDFEGGLWQHGKKMTLYTLMGVFTTLIFWGTEAGFWLIWRSDLMRETGAIIGLTIGYVVKYNLDRRFVFSSVQLRGSG